eukprot:17327-Heterococcus_DN1.PRE.1
MKTQSVLQRLHVTAIAHDSLAEQTLFIYIVNREDASTVVVVATRPSWGKLLAVAEVAACFAISICAHHTYHL